MIPDLWTRHVLNDLRLESEWNRQMRERGYHAAQIPVAPLHKRVRRVVRNNILNAREWAAKKLAPWIIHEDEWL
jgi:hypothetical protein